MESFCFPSVYYATLDKDGENRRITSSLRMQFDFIRGSFWTLHLFFEMHNPGFLVYENVSRCCGHEKVQKDAEVINKFDGIINSGNIISDISDHYSQFCIIYSVKEKAINRKTLRRDFSQFSEKDFTKDLSQIDWEAVVSDSQTNINRSFSTFFNKINKLIDRHAPFKTLSPRKVKRLSKPWITRGIRKSIKVKNSLYCAGNKALYKMYRNKILNISRQSKKLYYHNYFVGNLNNMKNTWAGINHLINSRKKKF